MTTETWLDTAAEVPQETVDTETQGYPFIQWVNGNKTLKQLGGVPYYGGWALPCDNIDAQQVPGWVRGSLTHGETETDVWLKRDITVALIRSRKAWTVFDGQTNRMFAWDQYDAAKAAGKPRGKLQMLAFVQELEGFGPFMLTLRGSYAKRFTDTVLPSFAKYVLAVTNKANSARGIKAKFPYRAFWLTIGPEREPDNSPHFTEVGIKPSSSLVVLPTAIGVSDKLTLADVGKLHVGRTLTQLGTMVYQEAEPWATALEQREAVVVEPLDPVGVAADGVEAIPF